MSTSVRTCPDCRSELPAASRFCPSCGTRTLQHVNAATGEIARPPQAITEEAAHRARLQWALGDAWQITRLIGRGGFAEVYAVWDVNLRREVAVKTLRHDIEVSAQMIQRFRREAESIARLRHPNIVPIYQVAEGEGLVYFMMPVIEGESLAAALVRGESFSIGDTCRVLREVAGALGAAHRTGVVHRDVKPDNIMLEGPERRAVVMDFGIAKLADAAEARLTGTGLLIGSPHYMSPEQAAGESELDHRSDEYSLAVVGYQMLAGRMPFEATSVQSILFKQMTETPPPISDIRADVPPALATALTRALSKKANDRFQSMEEFAAALPAADAGAGQRIARQALDIRARRALARQIVAKWRWPAMVAGVIGLAGALAIFKATTAASALALAGNQADAMFSAKAVLPPPRGAHLKADYLHEDSVYRFVYSAVGTRAVADSIASEVGVWRWRVRAPAAGPLVPTAEIGSGGRVLAFGGTWDDSISRPSVSSDSARALAEATVRGRGWQVSKLRFLGDSTSQRESRIDHLLQWDAGGMSLKARDGAPATRQVQVRVRGDTVGSYREAIVLPRSAAPSSRNQTLHTIANLLVTLISCAVAVFAFVAMVRRSRVDELQWKPIIVLTAAAAIPAVIYLGASALSGGAAGAAAWGAFAIALTVAVVCAFLVVPFAVGESVLSERHPASVSGIPDVSRGHLLVPEIVTATLAGYPAGLCLVALGGLLSLLWQSLFGRAAIGSSGAIMGQSFAALSPFLSLAYGIVIALAIAYGVSLFAMRRLPVAVILLGPALLVLITVFAGNMDPVDRMIVVADTFALTLLVWHFGVFAAFVAVFVQGSIDGLITLFAAGGTSGLMTALFAAGLVAAPGVIGFIAYRRLKLSPA